MCGIAGICNVSRDDAPSRGLLARMLAALRHRGPDDWGIHSDAACCLGNTRLSIIDLANGRQPISNEDGTLWIVFNGEIFNHVELRQELIDSGHVFRTNTDTEVVLHLYESHGPECLKRLNGDFAIAIWNGRKRELFLARDRIGVRPLYYTESQGRLLFASEIKALLADPSVPAEADVLALHQIFTFWSSVYPRTVFRGVHELPPGCWAMLRYGRLAVTRYWQLDFTEPDTPPPDEDQVAAELADLLVDSTRLRLRSDVPVGAYFSGGLDSSVVAAIGRKELGMTLDSFSISFSNEQFDESFAQHGAANVLGTRHHVLEANAQGISECFPDVIGHTETPLLRTGPAPMFLLSRMARAHGFKVVLTGEGADEFFAGYDIFKEAAIRRFCARSPGSGRRPLLFERLYHDAAARPADGSAARMFAAFFTGDGGETDSPYHSHSVRWRNTARTRRFFSADVLQEAAGMPLEPDIDLPSNWTRWHPLARAQYIEASVFLPNYLLAAQGDRAAMAHSVEGRYPFLDHRVIEFAARLPASLKLRGLTEKYILRKAARRWLPGEIAQRRKRAYMAPIQESFFHNRRPEYVDDLLSTAAIKRTGYFDDHAVTKLLDRMRRGDSVGQTDQMAFVGILSTQLWHDAFVRRRCRNETHPQLDEALAHAGTQP